MAYHSRVGERPLIVRQIQSLKLEMDVSPIDVQHGMNVESWCLLIRLVAVSRASNVRTVSSAIIRSKRCVVRGICRGYVRLSSQTDRVPENCFGSVVVTEKPTEMSVKRFGRERQLHLLGNVTQSLFHVAPVETLPPCADGEYCNYPIDASCGRTDRPGVCTAFDPQMPCTGVFSSLWL